MHLIVASLALVSLVTNIEQHHFPLYQLLLLQFHDTSLLFMVFLPPNVLPVHVHSLGDLYTPKAFIASAVSHECANT